VFDYNVPIFMIVHGTIGMDHLKLFRKRLVYSNFFRIHFLNFTL